MTDDELAELQAQLASVGLRVIAVIPPQDVPDREPGDTPATYWEKLKRLFSRPTLH